MIFTAIADLAQHRGLQGKVVWPGHDAPCAFGKGGVRPAADKRKGDGATPLGVWPLRRVLYRPDKAPPPLIRLPIQPISPADGWCDAPGDPNYNRPVRLPYAASHEEMWRQDDLYDLVVILGHNDSPPVPGLGSAIFMHLTHPGYTPTAGCVALARSDLEALLAAAQPGDMLEIKT